LAVTLLSTVAMHAQVSVRFEFLAVDSTGPVYRYSENLADVPSGDNISLSVGGAWASLTVRAIDRTGDRLAIDLAREVELADGRRVGRLEFVLRDSMWVEREAARRLFPPDTGRPATGADPSPPPPEGTPWVEWAGLATVALLLGVFVVLARRR
jgi:hypothetical protein